MLRFKDLMERINIAKTKMGDVIKDFQDSDAPQFKGKSNEKRRQMAIAAKLEADRGVKEEAEQIDELDTATLKSYRTKARAQGNAIVDKMKMGGGDWSKDQKDTKTLRKRAAGANMSGKQLVKRGESLKTEDVEELDEVAAEIDSIRKTLQSRMNRIYTPNHPEKKDSARLRSKLQRLKKKQAAMKEEVEQTDEELKGNQHKIDANKNGKVDGHDFKILRNAKKARYQ